MRRSSLETDKLIIKAAIRYETPNYDVTLSPCPCGRMSRRGEKCVKCWQDELEALDREAKS